MVLANYDYCAHCSLVDDRYRFRESKFEMAYDLNEKRPSWTMITCRRRIDLWFSLAVLSLYALLCEVFGKDTNRFKLQIEQEDG